MLTPEDMSLIQKTIDSSLKNELGNIKAEIFFIRKEISILKKLFSNKSSYEDMKIFFSNMEASEKTKISDSERDRMHANFNALHKPN